MIKSWILLSVQESLLEQVFKQAADKTAYVNHYVGQSDNTDVQLQQVQVTVQTECLRMFVKLSALKLYWGIALK